MANLFAKKEKFQDDSNVIFINENEAIKDEDKIKTLGNLMNDSHLNNAA